MAKRGQEEERAEEVRARLHAWNIVLDSVTLPIYIPGILHN
jgi:hypothetical protein